MTIPSSIRDALKIGGGILLGSFGAALFTRSLPPAEGSPEAKVFAMEHELKSAQQRIRTLEDLNPNGTRKSQGGFLDNTRSIVQDLRDGKKVSPDDLWRSVGPILAPFIGMSRKKDEARRIDSRVGEFSRKYELSPEQQQGLRNFFTAKSEENQLAWKNMLNDPNAKLLDMQRASKKLRHDAGLDAFMETTLQGEKLAEYKSSRLAEKLENVQRSADRRMERLNSMVPLDEGQKDKVFAIMARGSDDYDPSMQLEGLGSDVGQLKPGASTFEAVQGVLRPEQLVELEQQKIARRQKAEEEAAEFQMTLPEDWDAIDQGEIGWSD
jgi:hypothetical protein